MPSTPNAGNGRLIVLPVTWDQEEPYRNTLPEPLLTLEETPRIALWMHPLALDESRRIWGAIQQIPSRTYISTTTTISEILSWPLSLEAAAALDSIARADWGCPVGEATPFDRPLSWTERLQATLGPWNPNMAIQVTWNGCAIASSATVYCGMAGRMAGGDGTEMVYRVAVGSLPLTALLPAADVAELQDHDH